MKHPSIQDIHHCPQGSYRYTLTGVGVSLALGAPALPPTLGAGSWQLRSESLPLCEGVISKHNAPAACGWLQEGEERGANTMELQKRQGLMDWCYDIIRLTSKMISPIPALTLYSIMRVQNQARGTQVDCMKFAGDG